MTTSTGKLAAAMTPDTGTKVPTLRLRQGMVQSITVVYEDEAASQSSGYLVDITLAGDEDVVISDVSTVSDYVPQVGDTVWVLVNDVDLIAMDRAGPVGPSVFSNAARGYVEGRGSIPYSASSADPNLIEFDTAGGPIVTALIPETGWFLMGVSAVLEPVANVGGGSTEGLVAMSVTIAPLENPGRNRPTIVAEMSAALAYHGPPGSQLCASRVHLGAGLFPGWYQFAPRWGAGPTSGAMQFREIWVLPL